MACPAQDVTDTELSILKCLWEDGGLTIREIAEALYPDGSSSAYATVQSLLVRLEEKRLVRREPGQPAQRFHAAASREDVLQRKLREVAEKLTDGALSPLISTLVQAKPLSSKERREIIEVLTTARTRRKSGK